MGVRAVAGEGEVGAVIKPGPPPPPATERKLKFGDAAGASTLTANDKRKAKFTRRAAIAAAAMRRAK